MTNPSRQVATSDVASLVYVLFIVLYFLVFYWFYSVLKRIEKTLLEIKKLLEGRPANPTQ
jgi:hypothetical protein